MFAECTESVSILYAIIFGLGDACLLISMPSVLTALGVFLGLVIVAQLIARKLWARMVAPRDIAREPARVGNAREVVSEPARPQPARGAIIDDPNYAHSAIRSSKR